MYRSREMERCKQLCK